MIDDKVSIPLTREQIDNLLEVVDAGVKAIGARACVPVASIIIAVNEAVQSFDAKQKRKKP